MLKNEVSKITELCAGVKNEHESRFFEPVSEENLRMWEAINGITLPILYKEWLRFSDGAVIRGTLAHFYGINGIEVGNREFPADFVIIGDLMGDGERLGFSRATGQILRMNHGRVRVYEDFADFLNRMIIRMLVNEQSKRDMAHDFNQKPVAERKLHLNHLRNQSADMYNDFVDDLRDVAVQEFWTNERNLINQGECTRDWTPEQIEAILNISIENGMSRSNGGAAFYLDEYGNTVEKKHGTQSVCEVYDGHQMLSVDKFPEYAGEYRNMQALARNNGEHIRAHGGNYQDSTWWYFDYINNKYCKLN